MSGTAYGIIAFTVIVVIGAVVIGNLSASVANCPTAYSTYNVTSQLCTNSTGGTVNPSTSTQTGNYLNTQIGSSGLAGYTPAIVAISVGVLFLAYFGFKGKKY